MPSLGPLEVLIILIVAVLVFPPHKLPEVARQVGQAMAALRRFQGTLAEDFERLVEPDERDETPKIPPKSRASRQRPADATPSEPEAPHDEERPPGADGKPRA